MEVSMPERRKIVRKSISYYLRIIDANTNLLIGHLADISSQGIKIDSQKTLPLNRDYRLRIHSTKEVSDKEYVEFSAKARWCKTDPLQPGLYNIGFEIVEIERSDSKIIQTIVEKYSTREPSYNF
jgi:hypothetical protein